MIEVENLWKVYDTVEAVRDLSFAVHPGELLGLVGPNGAGKTSTMRCLCGIIPPSAGEIRICGISMYDAPVEAKRRVAFVPSEPRYFPYLTVWEHLQMFARLYECGDQSERAEQLLESMSLIEKRDHLPESLSRGMQQKLMIGCALIHMPQVLIFDEPFTGLDPLAIRNIREILRSCADEGAAVLLSSHLLAMVEDMVDGVLIIQNGEKIAQGALSELAATMPSLRKDADLEEIFLHATGRRLASAVTPESSAVEVLAELSALEDASAAPEEPAVIPVETLSLASAEVSEEIAEEASVDASVEGESVVLTEVVAVASTEVVPSESVEASAVASESEEAPVSIQVEMPEEAHEETSEGMSAEVSTDTEVSVSSLEAVDAGEPAPAADEEQGAQDAPQDEGVIPGQLPLSSSEILPQYSVMDASRASLDDLDAVPDKWFADAEDEEGKGQ